METLKRARSINWSEQEKKVLRMLVLEQADIIENKDTSTNSNSTKKLAWEEVLSRFNAVNANKRDMAQLHTQWRNMKNRAKKAEFAYRRARNMTGGGPPPPSPSPDDKELIEGIPNEFTVDSNCYDSDSINLEKLKPTQPFTPIQNLPKVTSSPARILLKPTQTLTPIGNLPKVMLSSLAHVQLKPTQTLRPIQNLPKVTLSSPAHVQPEMSRSVDKPGPSLPKKKKKLIGKTDDMLPCCCNETHEHQLFQLAKTSREKAMLHEEEIYKKKLVVMALEEEYWKTKINNIK